MAIRKIFLGRLRGQVMTEEEMLYALGFEKWTTVITEYAAIEEVKRIINKDYGVGAYIQEKPGRYVVWYVPKE